MHYEYEYEVTDEVAELVIKNLLELYEKHKNDKNIFKKIKTRLGYNYYPSLFYLTYYALFFLPLYIEQLSS